MHGSGKESRGSAAPWVAIIAGLTLLSVLATASGSSVGGRDLSPALLPSVSTHCPVGYDPAFPAYNPTNHDLYVPNQLSSNVSIIAPNCATLATITFAAHSDPYAAVFDPSNDYVYVSLANTHKVVAIHELTLVHNISNTAMDHPTGLAYDPALNSVIVAD
jgi:DNA-binding beta-propeller fold protein YncE